MKVVFNLLILYTISLIRRNVNSQILDYSGKNWPEQCYGFLQSPIDFPLDTSEYIPLNSTRILFSSYKILRNVSVQVLSYGKFSAKNDDMGQLYFEKNGLLYKYILNEIHWHYRAEHTFGGEEFDLEMHMLHTKDNDFFIKNNIYVDEDPDEKFQKLVIAIIFKENDLLGNLRASNGNEFISKLKFSTLKTIDPIDLNEFARKDRLFLHYEGSLTTPTCNETVNWIVMTQFESISKEQLDNFYNLIKKNGYPKGNHRQTQKLNDRKIYYNDINSLNAVQNNFALSVFYDLKRILIIMIIIILF